MSTSISSIFSSQWICSCCTTSAHMSSVSHSSCRQAAHILHASWSETGIDSEPSLDEALLGRVVGWKMTPHTPPPTAKRPHSAYIQRCTVLEEMRVHRPQAAEQTRGRRRHIFRRRPLHPHPASCPSPQKWGGTLPHDSSHLDHPVGMDEMDDAVGAAWPSSSHLLDGVEMEVNCMGSQLFRVAGSSGSLSPPLDGRSSWMRRVPSQLPAPYVSRDGPLDVVESLANMEEEDAHDLDMFVNIPAVLPGPYLRSTSVASLMGTLLHSITSPEDEMDFHVVAANSLGSVSAILDDSIDAPLDWICEASSSRTSPRGGGPIFCSPPPNEDTAAARQRPTLCIPAVASFAVKHTPSSHRLNAALYSGSTSRSSRRRSHKSEHRQPTKRSLAFTDPLLAVSSASTHVWAIKTPPVEPAHPPPPARRATSVLIEPTANTLQSFLADLDPSTIPPSIAGKLCEQMKAAPAILCPHKPAQPRASTSTREDGPLLPSPPSESSTCASTMAASSVVEPTRVVVGPSRTAPPWVQLIAHSLGPQHAPMEGSLDGGSLLSHFHRQMFSHPRGRRVAKQ